MFSDPVLEEISCPGYVIYKIISDSANINSSKGCLITHTCAALLRQYYIITEVAGVCQCVTTTEKGYLKQAQDNVLYHSKFLRLSKPFHRWNQSDLAKGQLSRDHGLSLKGTSIFSDFGSAKWLTQI